ncbi:MAG: hypothetical protein ACLPHP_01745 [Candidatus Sulfotelmatobacter sp.]
MPSRLLNSILFAGIFAIGVSSAQEGTAEVPVPGNVYAQIMACGADGQAYFPLGGEHSTLRVSLDGSTLTFRLPGKVYPNAVAPYADGVNVLGRSPGSPEPRFVIYHFDNLGNLLTQHPVPIDLTETMMATTSSGTTILVGHHPAMSPQDDDWKYRGLVLDAEDRVVSRFELPSPPPGQTWTFNRKGLITAGDGAAYVLLHSDEPPTTMIATISESGKLSVKPLPEPMLGETRYIMWLVGPGVAVEMYHLDDDRTLIGGLPVFRFDEYDLKTGKKIASKAAPMGSAMPFAAACYYGNSVTGLGARMQVMPDEPYLRLRIAKLQ